MIDHDHRHEDWDLRVQAVRQLLEDTVTDIAMASLAQHEGGDVEQLGYLVYDRLEAHCVHDLSLAVVLLLHESGRPTHRLRWLQRQMREMST